MLAARVHCLYGLKFAPSLERSCSTYDTSFQDHMHGIACDARGLRGVRDSRSVGFRPTQYIDGNM